MAHPLKGYARYVQQTLTSKDRSYQWCLKFVQTHWDEVKDLPKQERREKLAEAALRIAELADQALKRKP